MANIQNLDYYNGTSRTLNLAARDESNNRVNLTGLTISWMLGRPPFAPWLVQSVLTKAGTITNAALGLFTVSLAPGDITLCWSGDEGGNYIHQAFTTDASGHIAVVTAGQFRLRSILQPMQ